MNGWTSTNMFSFIFGVMVGTLIGVSTMCLIYVSREEKR